MRVQTSVLKSLFVLMSISNATIACNSKVDAGASSREEPAADDASDDEGEDAGSESDPGSSTTPALHAPDVVDLKTYPRGIVFTWKPSTKSTAAKSTGYVVERAGPDGKWVALKDVDLKTTSYTDTTVIAGIQYSYRIVVVGEGSSKSLPSKSVSGKTADPMTLSELLDVAGVIDGSSSSSNTISLTLAPVSGADAVDSYAVSVGPKDSVCASRGDYVFKPIDAGMSVTLPAEGAYRLCVKARADGAPLEEWLTESVVTFDQTPPGVPFLVPAPGAATNVASMDFDIGPQAPMADAAEFRYSVTLGDPNSTPCDENTLGPWTPLGDGFTAAYSSPGDYVICLQVRDAAQNTRSTIDRWVVTKDVVPPSLSISGLDGGDATTGSVGSVTITSDDPDATYGFAVVGGNSAATCLAAITSTTTLVAQPLTIPTQTSGEKTLCVRIKDVAGNTTTDSVTWTVDADAPSPASLAMVALPSGSSNIDAFTISFGTPEIGGEYQHATLHDQANCSDAIYSAWTDTAVDANQDISSLADGTIRVCVRFKDSLGNETVTPHTFSWKKDKLAPIAVLDGVATGTSSAASLDIGVGPVGPTGDVTQYRHVLLTDDTDCDGATYSSWTNANVRITGPSGSDGEKTLCVLARDAAGNIQSAATTASWTLDRTAPVATLAGAPTGTSPTASLNVTVGPSGDATHYRFALVSGVATCTGATMSSFIAVTTPITASIGADGGKRLCVQARDAVNNVQSGFTEATWTKGAAGSTTPSLSGLPAAASKATALNITVGPSGTVDSYRFALLEGASVSCSGASYSSWTGIASAITAAIGPDGAKTLCVEVRDAALAPIGSALTHSWTKDTSATLAVTSPASGGYVNGSNLSSFAISGTCSDEGANVVMSGSYSDTTACVAGAFAFTVNASSTGEAASFTVNFSHTDTATNNATASATYTRDTVAPGSFTISGPSSTVTSGSANVTWAASTGAASYTVKVGTNSTCSAGTKTYTGVTGTSKTVSGLTTGSYYACVQAFDLAGNPRTATNDGHAFSVTFSGEFVLGQEDASTYNAATYGFSSSPIVSSDGTRMIVADRGWNRVLIYNTFPTSLKTRANVVLGQATATATVENYGGRSKRSLKGPSDAVSDGTRLAVYDADNRRILIWNTIPTVNYQAADVVLGQVDGASLSPDEVGLNTVGDGTNGRLLFDGGKLYVMDARRGRILVWNTIPTVDNTPPDFYLGALSPEARPGFPVGRNTGSFFGTAAGMTISGGKLIVASQETNRVLIWNTIPTNSFQEADVVIGQPDMSTATANFGGRSARSLSQPDDVAVIGGDLYVADNGRVLVYDGIPTTNFAAAKRVLGQSDFTTSTGTITAIGGGDPTSLAEGGGKLVVADGNGRLLIYNSIPTSNGVAADLAFGKPTPTDTSSWTSPSPDYFYSARSIAKGDDVLYVTDSLRVLGWSNVPTQDGVLPDFVLGEPGFDTSLGDIGLAGLASAQEVEINDGKLYVGASGKIAVWNALPTQTYQPASFVIGRHGESYAAGKGGLAIGSASDIHFSGTKMVVTDSSFHRVLVWNTIPVNGTTPPDVVVGQIDFDTRDYNQTNDASKPTASGLYQPQRSIIAEGRLIVSDSSNHRVLIWNSVPSTNGTSADLVLGQPNLTSKLENNGGLSARSLKSPSALAYHAGRLYVGDGNGRILVWTGIPTENFQAADRVLGQVDFTTLDIGQDLANRFFPSDLVIDGETLLVAESVRVRSMPLPIGATSPTVRIVSPQEAQVINSASITAVPVAGTCSEPGQIVQISGSTTGSATCSAGSSWSTTVDLSSVPDGAISLVANHSSEGGANAPAHTISLTKETSISLTVSVPANGATFDDTNASAVAASGTCSDEGGTVSVTGVASTSTTCVGGNWSLSLKMGTVAVGTHTVTFIHADANGNTASVSRNLDKVGVGRVKITSPAQNSYMNSSAGTALTISGTCSPSGAKVRVEGPTTNSTTCSSVGRFSAPIHVANTLTGAFQVAAYLSISDVEAAQDSIDLVRDITVSGTMPSTKFTPTNGSTSGTSAVKAIFTNSNPDVVGVRYQVVVGACPDISARPLVALGSVPVQITEDVSAFASGTVSFCVRYQDVAGNLTTIATPMSYTRAVTAVSASPTTFTATASSSRSVSLSWAAVAGASNYLIVAKKGSAPTWTPTNGTTYAANAQTDTERTFVAASTSVNDLNLTAGESYYYVMYPYSTSLAYANSIATNVTLPVGPVATISGNPTGESGLNAVSLKVGGINVTQYRWKAGLTASTTCSNPSGYSPVASGISTPLAIDLTAIGAGAVTVCVLGGDASDAFQSESVPTSIAWTYDKVAPSTPGSVAANSAGAEIDQMRISWTASTGSPVEYMVVRRTGSAVTWTPTDGQIYSVGALDGDHTLVGATPSLFVVDSGAASSTTYHYAVFARDAARNYSSAGVVSGTLSTTVRAVLTDAPGVIYTPTSLNVTVGGTDVTQYKYKFGAWGVVDCYSSASYSAARPIGTKITDALTGSVHDQVQLCVVGADTGGVWQSYNQPTQVTFRRGMPNFSSTSWTMAQVSPMTTPTYLSVGSTVGVTGATSYTWRVYQTNTCSGSPVIGPLTIQSNSANFTPPPAPGQYYYCGVATDVYGNTVAPTNQPFSVVYDNEPPGNVTLTTAQYSSTTPTVSWPAATNAVSYQVSIRQTNCSGAVLASNADNVGTSFTPGSALPVGSSLYLCVAAKNSRGLVGTQASTVITIDQTPPNAFSVTGPSGTVSGTPTVTWGASTGASTYDVIIDDEGTCSAPYVAHYKGITSTSYVVAPLRAGTYFACVKAYDVARNVRDDSNSPKMSFTSVPIGAFSITGPFFYKVDGGYLAWSSASGATKYDVVYATGADCSSGVIESSTVTTASALVPSRADGSTIKACVTALDEVGNTLDASNGPVTLSFDGGVPTLSSGSLTPTYVGSAKVRVAFSQASDGVTAQGSMRYLVYSSAQNNITTLEDIDANGTTTGTYFTGMSSAEAGLLPQATTLWVNVVAMDLAGNRVAYQPVSVTTGGVKWTGATLLTSAAWSTERSAGLGTATGQFNKPSGVTSDGTYLYVVDTANGRVQRSVKATGAPAGWIGYVSASPTGGDPGCAGAATFNFTPGWCIGGTSTGTSATNGAMNQPMDVIHHDGDLYVADAGNSRINRYDAETGAFLGWIGRIGTAPASGPCAGQANNFSPDWCVGGTSSANLATVGSFSAPQALTIVDGVLYVADSGFDRVAAYNLSPLSIIGWLGTINNTTPTLGGACTGASVGTNTTGWCTGGQPATSGTRLFNDPSGVAVVGSYLYVADRTLDKVLRFNLVAGSRDAAGDLTMSQVSSTHTGYGPEKIVADDDYLYVAVAKRNYVGRFDLSDNSFAGWIGGFGSTAPSSGDAGCDANAKGKASPGWCLDGGSSIGSDFAGFLVAPTGLLVEGGTLFVTEALHPVGTVLSNHRLQKFNAGTGVSGGSVGSEAKFTPIRDHTASTTYLTVDAPDRISTPKGIVADADYFYVLTSATSRRQITRYDRTTGAPAGWIGLIGVSPSGGEVGCAGAAVDTVTPGWCLGGSSKAATGATNGGIYSPYDMTKDSNYLYVAEGGSSTVQRFNLATGAFAGWIGRVGTTAPTGGAANCTSTTSAATPGWCLGGTSGPASNVPGGFNVSNGVAVDEANDYLFVSDGSRIQRFVASSGAYAGWIGRITNVAGNRPTLPASCASQALSTPTPEWCMNGQAIGGSSTSETSFSPNGVEYYAGYLYVSDAGKVARIDASDGSFEGWSGLVGATPPTGGATGCTTAASGTPTPGWCFGGVVTGSGGTSPTVSPEGIFTVISSRILKFRLDGKFGGTMAKLSMVPSGGDPGCTSLSANMVSRMFCLGGGPATGTELGAFTSAEAAFHDGEYLHVVDQGRIVSFPNP